MLSYAPKGKSQRGEGINSFVIGLNLEGIVENEAVSEDMILFSNGVADIKQFSNEFAKNVVSTSVEESVHITQTEFDFNEAIKQDNGKYTEGAAIPYESRNFENQAHAISDSTVEEFEQK